MQQVPNEFLTAIKRGYHIKGKPLVIAEWNFNHFVNNTVTNFDPPETEWPYNELYFPLSSITDTIRPSSGIFYAFTDESVTSEAGTGLPSQRYYTLDENNKYKYWVSPTLGSANEIQDYGAILDGDPPEYVIENASPQVVYDHPVNINKVKVTFNLGPTPISWKVYLNISDVWTLAATNPTIDAVTGFSELWWNGVSWVSNQQLSESTYLEVKGVRVVIETMDTMSSRVQLVELACLREVNLTSRVADYSVDLTMDEEDFLYPVGQISANSGSVTLSNHDLVIDDQNRSGVFAGLLNAWCQFRLYVDYDLSDYEGASSYLSRVATMYTNEWRQLNESEYNIELFDIMKLLQDKICPAMLMENESIARVISTILDLTGVNSYSFQAEDFDPTSTIKYYWTNGEETVYEAIKNICKSHQAAVFVDEYGEIQLLTKNQIADVDDEEDWTFLGQQDGDDIADIIELKKKYETIANHVIIKYKKRQAKVDEQDLSEQPLTSKVWGADDSIVLRSSPLTNVVLTAEPDPDWLPEDSAKRFYLPQEDAKVWPYTGKVNINGEVISYDAKEYMIWNYTTNIATKVFVENDEQKRKHDLATWNSYPGGLGGTDVTRQNAFTGKFRVKERDLTGIGVRNHYVNLADGWYMLEFWHTSNAPNGKRVYRGDSSVATLGDYKSKSPWTRTQSRWSVSPLTKALGGGFTITPVSRSGQVSNSTLNCDTTDIAGVRNVSYVAMRKFEDNSKMRQFGTRIKFETEGAVAGIVLNLTNASSYDINDDGPASIEDATKGYFINITPTKTCDAQYRGFRDELMATYQDGPMGPIQHITSTRGVPTNIEVGKWYDLEVIFNDKVQFGGTDYSVVEVFINGQFISSFASTVRLAPTRYAGVHTGGIGKVSFDYFYATSTIGVRYLSGNYGDTDAFALKLPAGTDVTQTINLPSHPGPQGNLSLSLVAQQSLQVHSFVVSQFNPYQVIIKSNGLTYKDLGPITIPPRTKKTWDKVNFTNEPTQVEIRYTSSGNSSLLYETSQRKIYEYNPTNIYDASSDDSIWDVANGGFVSDRLNSIFFTGSKDSQFTIDEFGNIYTRVYFMDEFGAIAHEVRDFAVDLDVAPVKGMRVFCSNQKVKVTDHSYHPTRGVFTLTNASRKNEIVNGTEEIDDTNSIEHTLMLYGYILEDKGDQEKEVKNALSIKQRGESKLELQADWIFDDEAAKELADWIVDHWGTSKDTIELNVFSNTFTQIGDKVSIKYDNAGIDENLLYVITAIKKSFAEDGYTSSVSARQIR